jgi:hypothetical protein
MEERRRSSERQDVPEGVDPDIADIRPGPQPLADWQIETEEEK